MKRFTVVFVLLFSLQAYADSNDKKNYVSAHLGYRFTPFSSLGYGRSLFKEGVYFGFVEATGDLGFRPNFKDFIQFAYLSLGYGYEFMRDRKFSFGLKVFGEGGIGRSVKSNNFVIDLQPALGAFARVKITQKWSAVLKSKLPTDFLPSSTIYSLFGISLGVRYSF